MNLLITKIRSLITVAYYYGIVNYSISRYIIKSYLLMYILIILIYMFNILWNGYVECAGESHVPHLGLWLIKFRRQMDFSIDELNTIFCCSSEHYVEELENLNGIPEGASMYIDPDLRPLHILTKHLSNNDQIIVWETATGILEKMKSEGLTQHPLRVSHAIRAFYEGTGLLLEEEGFYDDSSSDENTDPIDY